MTSNRNTETESKRLALQKRTLENFEVFFPYAQELIPTPGVDGIKPEEVYRLYWGTYQLLDDDIWDRLEKFWQNYDAVHVVKQQTNKILVHKNKKPSL